MMTDEMNLYYRNSLTVGYQSNAKLQLIVAGWMTRYYISSEIVVAKVEDILMRRKSSEISLQIISYLDKHSKESWVSKFIKL